MQKILTTKLGLKLAAGVAAAAFMATGAAAVVTVTSTAGPDVQPLPANQTIIFDFEGAAPAGLSGNYDLVSGSVPNKYAAPLGDTSQFLTVPKDLSTTPISASLALGTGYKSLSFYWGSIDTYNSVSFYNGATLLGTITGGTLPPASGAQGDSLTNRRVNFTFGGQTADSIVFSSTNYAFELDNIAGAVPEPATWAMMVGGMGFVGFAMRRRKTQATVLN